VWQTLSHHNRLHKSANIHGIPEICHIPCQKCAGSKVRSLVSVLSAAAFCPLADVPPHRQVAGLLFPTVSLLPFYLGSKVREKIIGFCCWLQKVFWQKLGCWLHLQLCNDTALIVGFSGCSGMGMTGLSLQEVIFFCLSECPFMPEECMPEGKLQICKLRSLLNILVLILYQIFMEIAVEGVSALQKRLERLVSAPNRPRPWPCGFATTVDHSSSSLGIFGRMCVQRIEVADFIILETFA
jgi:hypothetical protein